MATLPLTHNQLHVILDALTRHENAIDMGDDDPTRIYEGVYPDGHPLRALHDYQMLVVNAGDAINAAIGASATESTINLVIEG